MPYLYDTIFQWIQWTLPIYQKTLAFNENVEPFLTLGTDVKSATFTSLFHADYLRLLNQNQRRDIQFVQRFISYHWPNLQNKIYTILRISNRVGGMNGRETYENNFFRMFDKMKLHYESRISPVNNQDYTSITNKVEAYLTSYNRYVRYIDDMAYYKQSAEDHTIDLNNQIDLVANQKDSAQTEQQIQSYYDGLHIVLEMAAIFRKSWLKYENSIGLYYQRLTEITGYKTSASTKIKNCFP